MHLPSWTDADVRRMHLALAQARDAAAEGEVPIGAIIVDPQGRILGKGRNEVERLEDPTAHAEILAITAACNALGSKYLTDCTLYVTLEPCAMCAGALKWAQLGGLVYGASEPKSGFSRHTPNLLHPSTAVRGGLLEAEAADLLRSFFQARRNSSPGRGGAGLPG